MGYTHYWDNTDKAISKETRHEFLTHFNAMMDICPDTVEVNVLEEERLYFNGIEARGEDHDTACFYFDGVARGYGTGKEKYWSFCKTARKPYDKFVVACLILAEELGIIEGWSSDGDDEDHIEGRELLKRAKENVLMGVDN